MSAIAYLWTIELENNGAGWFRKKNESPCIKLRTKRAIVVCGENEFHTGKLPALSENKNYPKMRINRRQRLIMKRDIHLRSMRCRPGRRGACDLRCSMFQTAEWRSPWLALQAFVLPKTRENALSRCLKPTAEILRGSFTTT